MKPIRETIRKIAGMSPEELRERGRQALLKSGERWFGIDQGELTDQSSGGG